MHFDTDFRHPQNVERVLSALRAIVHETGPIRLMEICGTHTMAIAKSGLRSLLPDGLELLSGPGCPVCVTPAGAIDEILRLSERPDILLTSYGDLLRVPGSVRGDSLLRRRSLGAQVRTVYSPMEALSLAEEQPEREVVFLGVGFETTAPGTAACLLEAKERGIRNFSVLSLLKRTEPALRALIEAPDFAVDGFLCPGHVAAITGAHAFAFLPDEYRLPAVVSGFEPGICCTRSTGSQRWCGTAIPPSKMNIPVWYRMTATSPLCLPSTPSLSPPEPCGADWEKSRTAH